MAVQTAVDVLARMLDGYGSSEQSIHHVGATSMEDGGDALHVVLEVGVPVGATGVAGAAPAGAALTDDGALTVRYPTDAVTSFPSPPDADVSAVPTSARVVDGEVLVSVEVTITPTGDARLRDDTAAGDGTQSTDRRGNGTRSTDRRGDGTQTTDRAEAADGAAEATRSSAATSGGTEDGDGERKGDVPDAIEAARNEAVPTYEDRAYLRAIYREYDTFSEMRAVIDMDVSTETVRRYMIDVGIHDPNSYETSGDGSDDGGRQAVASREESAAPAVADAIPDEQLVTDGVGLPDGLALEDLLEAVVDSSTVYEVTRRLDVDQRRTRELLEQLDLLELVMHRVADDHEREVTYGDVADRLRRVAGPDRTGSAT
jgi:hypothetical protein